MASLLGRITAPLLGPVVRPWGASGGDVSQYIFANAEAAALVARFTTPPTYARKALIDTLIGSLKTAGVWSKLDAFYMLAAADSQASRRNWIADQYNLTAVSGPTFTVDRGYAGDAAASHLDTGFNPTTAVGAQYTQNSAHAGMWSRTSAVRAAALGWFDGTDGMTIQARAGGDIMGGRANQAASLTAANADGQGYYGVARSASNSMRISKNGVTLNTGANASTALNNETFKIGRTTTSSYSEVQVAAALLGSNVTDVEELATYNAINTYLQAVGAA